MSTAQSGHYQRAKDAFNELIDLPPELRADRLLALQSESPALAQRVREQLAAASQPLPLLDQTAARSPLPQLDRYTIVRELGRGGMGVVWLAERDLGGVPQTVAIKQVAAIGADGDSSRRFERERRILAGLDHPHIAALLDGGTDAAGHAYLATQFVDGERLDQWCRMHAPDARSRIRLLRDIASAIAYAHRSLVVHRDLKPANILVTRDGQAKLLDFGIARALDDDPLTSDGQSQMTLRYAAPEQIAGNGAEAGVSVDIYALGVLMYELIAQAPMYRDASGSAGLIHAILNDMPPPPSSAAGVVSGADADLDAICLRAVRKRPSDRYPDAGALLADLERWLAREPVEARRGETGYRLRSFLRRRWPAVGAAALAVAGVGYHLVMQQKQLAEVERQRDRAQALAMHFSDLFEEATPVEIEAGDVSAATLLERSVDRLQRDTTRSPLTRASLLIASGSALGYLGHYPAAKKAASAALALAHSITPRDAELLSAAYSELAAALDKTGDPRAALSEAESGLALFDTGEARDPKRLELLLAQVAMLAESSGDKARARAIYEQISAVQRRHLDDPESLKSYLSAQTNLATGDGDSEIASKRLHDALALSTQHHYDNAAVLLPMRTYLAVELRKQQRLAEARALAEPALADARAFYGTQDIWLSMILDATGYVLVFDGDPVRGDTLLAESHALSVALVGADHLQSRAIESDRAIASVMAADWPEAKQRLDRVIAWMDQAGRGDRPRTRYLQAARAYVEAHMKPDRAHLDALIAATAGLRRNDRSESWASDEWTRWAQSTLATP